MWRPHTLAEVVRREQQGENREMALAEFLDTFYLALQRQGHAAAQACLDEPPASHPDAVFHAYLGAVGEHLALRWGLTVPRWTLDPSRFLRRPFFTAKGMEGLKAMCIAESPTAFRRRLIFTEAEPLRRARLPRDTSGRALEASEIPPAGSTAKTYRREREEPAPLVSPSGTAAGRRQHRS